MATIRKVNGNLGKVIYKIFLKFSLFANNLYRMCKNAIEVNCVFFNTLVCQCIKDLESLSVTMAAYEGVVSLSSSPYVWGRKPPCNASAVCLMRKRGELRTRE